MEAKQFDQAFEEGIDILKSVDLTQAKRPLQEQRLVNVDFPKWMIERLDKEAGQGGDPQSVIKIWLAERLEKEAGR